MLSLVIHPETKKFEKVQIHMQANTIYSFFNSILIDESTTLKDHTIYTDSNAMEENKTPFFLGEQLLFGKTLICGLSAQNDCDTSIPLDTLKNLISYEINPFYQNVLALLSLTDINLYRRFYISKESEKIEINIEWVLYTFNIADEKTKEYFLNEVKNSLKEKTTQKTLEHLAQLAMNAA